MKWIYICSPLRGDYISEGVPVVCSGSEDG